jgi:hypothetical protein
MIDPKKFTYTIKWTQSPSTWDKKMFEQARLSAYQLEEQAIEKMLESNGTLEAKLILDRISKK